MSFKFRQTMDHEKAQFNLARLRKGGLVFEIVIDPDPAIAFKKAGNIGDVSEVMRSEHIFHDAKKGEVAKSEQMMQVFNTSETLEVAKMILKDGEVQLTAEHRQKLVDEKKKKIIAIIARNAADPRTKLPHPAARIEAAIEQAKVKINEFKSAEEQVDDVVAKLRPLLPIHFETKKIQIKIPAQYAGKAFSVISKFAHPSKDEWRNDGSYVCIVEIPAGLEPDLYEKVNAFTHGNAETKVMEEQK